MRTHAAALRKHAAPSTSFQSAPPFLCGRCHHFWLKIQTFFIMALGVVTAATFQVTNNEKEDMSNINYQKETMHC